jgi:hypothetical protein
MEWHHTHSTMNSFEISEIIKSWQLCWDWRGFFWLIFTPHRTTIFTPHRTTINTAGYWETLKGLKHPIQNTRRGLLTCSVSLLHNSARAHTVRPAQQMLQCFRWEDVDHPAHRLDLLPNDFSLLLHLKKLLRGQKFQEDEKVKHIVTTWLCSLTVEFCDFRIQKLTPRLNKCLDRGGDYVENSYRFVLKSFCTQLS